MTKRRSIRPLVAAAALAASVLGLLTAAAPASVGASGTDPDAAPVAVCADPAPGQAACQAEVVPTAPAVKNGAFAKADVTPPTSGYGPADVQSAYALASAVEQHAGRGRTVGIVDAYDDPTVEADLALYRSTYGLPACTTDNGCFRKVNQEGDAAPLPTADPSWATEISLDVDAVSAACPDCSILLVEADFPGTDQLAAGVDTAVRLGASVVSNSYSASESAVTDNAAGIALTDGLPATRTSYDHPGVPILAASGDAGYQLDAPYPADLTTVIAVGGTSLARSDGKRGWTETAWGPSDRPIGAGAACSAHIDKPSWQHDTACPGRTVADVSALADPATGLAVYDSTPDPADGLPGGWLRAGGTSAATPLVSAMYAMAGPARGIDGASALYTHSGGLNDVVGGSVSVPGSGRECPDTSYLCTARKGYDAPTGLGSPNGLTALAR